MSVPIGDGAVGRVDLTTVEPPGKRLPPLHAGEVLREEFLGPLDMPAYGLAEALRVPL